MLEVIASTATGSLEVLSGEFRLDGCGVCLREATGIWHLNLIARECGIGRLGLC